MNISMTHVKREWKEKTIMSKHEGKALPTFTVVQARRVISTWIIQCQDEDTAIEIASTSKPDYEEVDQEYEFQIDRGV